MYKCMSVILALPQDHTIRKWKDSVERSSSFLSPSFARSPFLLSPPELVWRVCPSVRLSVRPHVHALCAQKISGSVTLRRSHCCERLPLQSLTLGTWLSSSDALSRHWLLFTCTRVSFCTEREKILSFNNPTFIQHFNKSEKVRLLLIGKRAPLKSHTFSKPAKPGTEWQTLKSSCILAFN